MLLEATDAQKFVMKDFADTKTRRHRALCSTESPNIGFPVRVHQSASTSIAMLWREEFPEAT